MKGNKYIEEDDYYDDEYDAYDEPVQTKKKPAKNQNKQPDNKQISNNKANTQVKGNTSQQKGKPQDQKKTESTKKTTADTQHSSQINTNTEIKTFVEHNEEKIKLFNSQYPKINYGISVDVSEKANLNLVIIGHVDSGKSTIMGHLLYLVGEVDDRTMKKFEKESKVMKKNTFHFAFALDENEEERKRGVTMDIAFKSFQTKSKKVTIIDAPGHKDFVPNMISGAAFADCAILVIDSTKNGFDAGFFTGGQTKEHAILARSLGVGQLIVAVNKLDMSDWDKERFDYVKTQVEAFLLGLDFKQENIIFVPVSGLNGINLVENKADIPNFKWYEGPTLLEAIDLFKDPVRNYNFPARLMINDCGHSKIQSLQGFSVFGKVEGGFFEEGKNYLLMPHFLTVKARAVGDFKNEKVDFLKSGETGEIIISVDESVQNIIKSGNVLSSIENHVPTVKAIRAQILTLDLKMPLTIGQELVLHCQSQKSTVKLRKIDKLIVKPGENARTNSKFVPKNHNAVITLDLDHVLCLEVYSNLKSFGRITLRDSGVTVAAGIVTEILK